MPGASLFLQAGQDLRIGGRQSSAQYQYTIQSDNLDDLVKWGPILLAQMKKLPGFTEVNTDQQNNGLQASLVYDRATAARLGISAQTIDNTLYDAFGQAQVSTMYTSLNQYHVVMEVAPQFWQGPQGLDAIYLRATNQQFGRAAQCHRALRADDRAHRRESSGTIPVRHPLVQSRAGIRPERRGEDHSANGANHQNARNEFTAVFRERCRPFNNRWGPNCF